MRNPTPALPARLGVVVPARNEADGLGRCLAALDRAARAARTPLEAVVVLDACDDGSEKVAARAARSLSCRVHCVSIEARSVGTARRIGVERLLEAAGPAVDWVSTTDADSVVPDDWFRRQLAHRAVGATVVAGTVHVAEWEDLEQVRPQWEREYVADAHRHVHGANLSFAASAYRRAGGFDDVTSDEDVRLVRAFADQGDHIVWATDLSVATSARRVGRAPHGFAAYLNRMSTGLAAVTAGEAV